MISPLDGDIEDEEEMEEKLFVPKQEPETPPPAPKKKRSSAQKIPDPYMDESSTLIPIVVAIAAVLPFLFCLCKLWFVV